MLTFWVLTSCGVIGNHLTIFSLEDGESMFLRSKGVYLRDSFIHFPFVLNLEHRAPFGVSMITHTLDTR
jgi:hypothetical protein